MNENKLPKFNSLEKLVEFFDHQDLGKYWDALPEAQFEVDLKKKSFLVSVECGDLIPNVTKCRQFSARLRTDQLG